ncbi:carboxylesterase/lipase family protein [Aurantivibrio infirmus]
MSLFSNYQIPSVTSLPLIMLMMVVGLVGCSSSNDESPAAIESANPVSQLTDPLVRSTVSGDLKGVIKENGSYAWLGIPFAKPPVGELRWKLPQPIDPWDGIFEANKTIQPCPQFVSTLSAGIEDLDGDKVVGDEDCLYLSVYAPTTASPENPLPVMYWIFGGGNNSGYAGDYDASNLAETQNVVVVAVNYRLGPLGWFLHPAVLEEGASGAAASGNWSTVDTISGLEWVRDNITAFGGDKNNVTIFGESAGAGNVMSLVTSPMANNLFHKAIVESGGVGTTSMEQGANFVDDEAPGHAHSSREIVNKILIRDGKASNRETAKDMQMAMSDAEIKELLYSQSAAEFLTLYNPEATRNYPAPKKFTDGSVFLETPPLEQLAKGEYNQVPIILGTNRDELRIYQFREPTMMALLEDDPDEYIRIAKYQSDAWKLRGVDDLARLMSPLQAGNVYTYRFDWDEEASSNGTDLSIAVGAAHATEMAFVFNNWDVGFIPKETMYDPSRNESRDLLSSRMGSYWANFAYTGSPGKGREGSLPEWKAWQNEPGEAKMMILDTEEDGGVRMSNLEVSADSIKSEFMNDTFSSPANKCSTYRATFLRMGNFDREEYEALGCGN